MNLDFSIVFKTLPLFLKATSITVCLTIISMFMGVLIGLFVAILRQLKLPVIEPILRFYVSIIRGTPLLVQLFLLYFGLPQLIPQMQGMDSFTASVIAMSLNTGAYAAETFRSAIGSVPKGQMEAGLSMGMSYYQTMRRIILPQAFLVAIPPLGNSLNGNLKETSVVFTIGVADLMAKANMLASANFRFLELFLAAALIYWALSLIVSYVQGKIENRLSKAY